MSRLCFLEREAKRTEEPDGFLPRDFGDLRHQIGAPLGSTNNNLLSLQITVFPSFLAVKKPCSLKHSFDTKFFLSLICTHFPVLRPNKTSPPTRLPRQLFSSPISYRAFPYISQNNHPTAQLF